MAITAAGVGFAAMSNAVFAVPAASTSATAAASPMVSRLPTTDRVDGYWYGPPGAVGKGRLVPVSDWSRCD